MGPRICLSERYRLWRISVTMAVTAERSAASSRSCILNEGERWRSCDVGWQVSLPSIFSGIYAADKNSLTEMPFGGGPSSSYHAGRFYTNRLDTPKCQKELSPVTSDNMRSP